MFTVPGLDMASLELIGVGSALGVLFVLFVLPKVQGPKATKKTPIVPSPATPAAATPEAVPGLVEHLRERRAQRELDAEIATLLREQASVGQPPKAA